MARSLAGAFFALLMLSSFAAAQEFQARKEGDPLIPTCNFPRALCRYVDRDNNTVIAPQFDWAERFHDDRAMVVLSGKYGFVDRAGALVVPLKFDLAGNFVGGHAEVLIDGKVGAIDIAGRWVVPARYGRVLPLARDRFLVDVSPYRSPYMPGFERFPDRAESTVLRGQWGLLALSGAWVVEPKFGEIQFLSRDAGELFWAKSGRKWQLMNASGVALTEAAFDHVQPLLEDRAVVTSAGKWGAIDGQARMAIAARFEWLSYFDDGMAFFREGGKTGMVDREGRVLIPARFDQLSRFEGSRAKAQLNGAKVWIDRSGQVIGGQDECPDGRKLAQRDGKTQIVDREENPVSALMFEWVRLICDAPSIVKFGDKWGYIDTNGRVVGERYFDNVTAFHGGIALVTVGREQGIIDESGAFLLGPMKIARGIWVSGTDKISIETEDGELVLDKARVAELARDPGLLAQPLPPHLRCGDGVRAFNRDGKWGFTDKTGAVMIEPRFDAVGCFSRGLASAAIPERREWCQIDKRGEVAANRPCHCGQPLVIYEHWTPKPKNPGDDCYQIGLDELSPHPR